MRLLSSSSSLCSTPLPPPSLPTLKILFDLLLVREVTLCLALYVLRTSITVTKKLLRSSLSQF